MSKKVKVNADKLNDLIDYVHEEICVSDGYITKCDGRCDICDFAKERCYEKDIWGNWLEVQEVEESE